MGFEREYDDYVDDYRPWVAPPPSGDPRPSKGDSRLGPNGWETYDGTTWVASTPPVVTPPRVTPPPGGPTTGTRRPSRPGFYEEWDGAKWTEYSDGGPLRSGRGDADADTDFSRSPSLRSLGDLWPEWNPPTYDAQTFTPPPAFSYEDFRAPTMAEAESEPGYEFAATQGRKQVEATKAAQGTYRSGATLKDIYAWASEYAKQNYSGVFDRKLTGYGVNRNNAADAYMTNYGVSRDTFDRNYGSQRDAFDRKYGAYRTGFDSKSRRAELDFSRDWDVYASDRDVKKFLVEHGDD